MYDISRTNAPINIEPINTNVLWLPTNLLTICGPTNPMNPMTPKKETTTAVRTADITRPMNRVANQRTPCRSDL